MEEMKSALERALERADQLGKLSPEELRKKQEAEYIPIGEGIARRYFEHGYTRILAEQLDKFDGEEKSLVTGAALSTLVQSIDLHNKALTERALEGIIGLKGNASVETTSEEIMGLFGQYAWQEKLWYAENSGPLGEAVRERLHQAGITGSAVGEINIQTSQAWQRMEDELRAEFDVRLSELKKRLNAAINLA